MPLLVLPNELLTKIFESLLGHAWTIKPLSSEDAGVIWEPYGGPSSIATRRELPFTMLQLMELRSVCKRFNAVVSYWAWRTHRHGHVKLTPPWHDVPAIEWLVATRIRSQMNPRSGFEGLVHCSINAIQTWKKINGEEILPYDTYLREICKLFAVSKHPIRLLEWLETLPGSTRPLDSSAKEASDSDLTTPDTCGYSNAQALKASQGLQIAAFLGETCMVATLLEHGADPNHRNQHFGSALFAAAYNGHTEIASLLIEHGADLDTDESLGMPLDAAAHQGHIKTLALLLEHTTTGLRNTSLLHAIAHGHLKAVELLLSCGKVDIHSQSPFRESSSLLQPVNVHSERLFARNCIPAIPRLLYGYFTSTIPIMQAVCSDNEKILELLLQREDIDPNTCEGRRSALTAAVECQKDKMVRLLLSHADIKPNLVDPSGDRAIELAMKVGSDTIPVLIMERWRRDGLSIPQGCDSDANAHCLLVLALKNGLADTSAMLLLSYVPAQRCDYCKHRLFGFAAKWGLTTIASELRTQGIDVNSDFVDQPSSLDPHTSMFSTPLTAAIEAGRINMVRMLLSWPEVNPNHRPRASRPKLTPLGYAVWFKKSEMVQCLLERHDIRLDAEPFNEWPPLHVAVQVRNDIALELILSHPAADPNIEHDWSTALSCAIAGRQVRAVRYFLEHPSTDVNKALDELMGEEPNPARESILKLLLEHPEKSEQVAESLVRMYEKKWPYCE
ncbi:ankyrin repeat-containing domain protein [Xylariaceae sp. FL1272]|nr:ankyrin repeat-containing domain protein [Xylariaceae sp. FL1272]